MFADHSTLMQFAGAVFAVIISYPLLYWFLRRVKKVPLRFNVTVFVAFIAAGLLPMEFSGFEANRSAVQLDTTTMVFSMAHRIRDMTLVCDADPSKVSPQEIEAARQSLAASTVKWFNVRDPREITSAQWLKLDDKDKCNGGWMTHDNQNRVAFEKNVESIKWWLIASIVTSAIGILAMYQLIVSRVREDLRDAQVTEPVELKSFGEVLVAVFICVIAFLPFSLFLLRLFKFPKAADKTARVSAQ
ncbi:hypothetical protein ACXIVK_00230 [Paraburkholderia caledonica]|jgi:hypothetical protein